MEPQVHRNGDYPFFRTATAILPPARTPPNRPCATRPPAEKPVTRRLYGSRQPRGYRRMGRPVPGWASDAGSRILCIGISGQLRHPFRMDRTVGEGILLKKEHAAGGNRFRHPEQVGGLIEIFPDGERRHPRVRRRRMSRPQINSERTIRPITEKQRAEGLSQVPVRIARENPQRGGDNHPFASFIRRRLSRNRSGASRK